MKNTIYLALFLALLGCKNKSQTIHESSKPIVSDTAKTKEIIQYSEKELELFLDSIGKLSNQALANKVAFGIDSVFKNRTKVNKVLSQATFEKLKKAINKQEISNKTAQDIFGKLKIDSPYMEMKNIPIILHSFDKHKNDFDEFAITFGVRGEYNVLYFFKKNTLIAIHDNYHFYGLELEHYKDTDGKTIVYYTELFTRGSGIWWMNYNFYKYDDGQLIPILNELSAGNMQSFWGFRIKQLETTIVKRNPLSIKMVYYQKLPDTTLVESGENLINDSTIVTYTWNKKSKMLEGQYAKSKISKAEILTYYLNDNELLFINTYYQTLKSTLKDSKKRKGVLIYLNELKNYYSNLSNPS